MTRSIGTGALALALLLTGCGGSDGDNSSATASGATSAAAIPAPNGGDWTQTVTQTAEGGFLMGNPNAPVKVVEFASLTCGHCADFAENGMPALTERYIKTGRVSLELRNFVRDPADLAAALLSRCSGPTPYFKLTDQLFGAQQEWIGKLQGISPADQQRMAGLQPQQAVAAMAQQAGLVDFVRLRGVPSEKAQACLADEKALQRLVQMNEAAGRQYQITGTPTFLINNEVVPNASDWGTLEPRIRAALG